MSGLTIYAPWGRNTPSHKDGLILLSAVLNIIISLIALPFVVIRKGKSFGLSDGVACLAVTSSICQCIPLLISRKHGLGMSSTLQGKDWGQNGEYTFWSTELYVVSLGLGKLWVASFAWRLAQSSHMPTFKRACAAALAFAIIWTVATVIAIAVRCPALNLHDTNNFGPVCSSRFLPWLGTCILDAVSDMSGLLLVMWLIWPLQIETGDKIAIALSFMLKPIGGIPFSVARLLAVHRYASSSDKGIAIVAVIIWQNAQLCWTALSAAAPSMLWMKNSFDVTRCEDGERVLPSIFGDVQYSSGARTGRSKRNSHSEGRDDSHGHKSDSYAMRRIRTKVPSTKSGGHGGFLPETYASNYDAKVQAVCRASSGSNDSEAKLIRVDVARSVVHENRGE